MKKIIVLIQLLFVTLTIAQQQATDAVVTGPFYLLPAPWRASAFPAYLHQCPPVERRDDYTHVAGIGSYKLHERTVPWNEARMTCEEEGGYLTIINSVAEANAVSKIFTDAEAITRTPRDLAWIGFHDLYQDGQYITIHGQSLAKAGYTRFAPAQPDNLDGTEDCGSVHKDGGLHDVHCSVRLRYICEIPIW